MPVEIEQFRVQPGRPVRLGEVEPEAAAYVPETAEAETEIRAAATADIEILDDLQHRLYAEERQSLLVVFLAIDTGGKDSTIRHIFSGVNPQGCRVVSFRTPSQEEASHDFLWRIHPHAPAKGMMTIFNRSHYEDVTFPMVHGLLTPEQIERRYRHIRAFEELLIDAGTRILKFHLRISKEEQAERIRERLEKPAKHWKFDPSDLDDRKRWDGYQAAFEAAINATSTGLAPWYVVPADNKWFRDAVVARVIVQTLQEMDPRFPAAVPNIEQYSVS